MISRIHTYTVHQYILHNIKRWRMKPNRKTNYAYVNRGHFRSYYAFESKEINSSDNNHCIKLMFQIKCIASKEGERDEHTHSTLVSKYYKFQFNCYGCCSLLLLKNILIACVKCVFELEDGRLTWIVVKTNKHIKRTATTKMWIKNKFNGKQPNHQ